MSKTTPKNHPAYAIACVKCKARAHSPCMRPRGVAARTIHQERARGFATVSYNLAAFAEWETPEVGTDVILYSMIKMERLMQYVDAFAGYNSAYYMLTAANDIELRLGTRYEWMSDDSSHLARMMQSYKIRNGEGVTTCTDETIDAAFAEPSTMWSNVNLAGE